eukprot:NODE_2191_length_499_cov_735.222222_g1789_i0.p1 GENE.NODE_2191_length_499_cov_735.222222_g1789_i0~~NODE_2191_length_499_cov_735.222222_g1789_i0.p1  ORF type:complete len:134 (-),score=16.33 NODE_2191_length_499_cov_735.222222_g1789_i0:68-469(-)
MGNGNYFGASGLRAVLRLMLGMRRLRQVSFKSMALDNDNVKDIADMAVKHPSLEVIDLSENPRISLKASKPLLRLVRDNKRIVSMTLTNTQLSEDLCERIYKEVQENQIAQARSEGAVRKRSQVHPRALSIAK